MKRWFTGSEWHSFGSGQPRFKIEHEERMVCSTPIFLPERNVSITLRGKYDSILLFEDGTRAVCDFKTAPVKEQYIEKYAAQLHAYAYALNHPAPNSLAPGEIHSLGLAVFEPRQFSCNGAESATLSGSMKWIEMERNDSRFLAFLDDIAAVLEKPMPEPSATCFGLALHASIRANSSSTRSRTRCSNCVDKVVEENQRPPTATA